MDSFEWNKISGGVLAAAVIALALTIGADMLYAPHSPEKKGYAVEGVEAEASADAPAGEAEPPIEALLASADPAKGAAVFKKCAACHNVQKGGANGIGPNLYGVMGAPHARAAGFGYSAALSEKKGERWDWGSMNAWLKSPKAAIPGNKMSFAGLGKPDDRAAVLAYLNAQSDSPLPLPAAPAAAAAAAPAGDATATAAIPAAEQPAPQAGKAPDVPESAEPAVSTGGPGSRAAGKAQ